MTKIDFDTGDRGHTLALGTTCEGMAAMWSGNTEPTATSQTTQVATQNKKPGYHPVITASGRVSVAPVLAWSDLGSHLNSSDQELGPAWMQEKAATLRALGQDLLAQAEAIEAELQSTR